METLITITLASVALLSVITSLYLSVMVIKSLAAPNERSFKRVTIGKLEDNMSSKIEAMLKAIFEPTSQANEIERRRRVSSEQINNIIIDSIINTRPSIDNIYHQKRGEDETLQDFVNRVTNTSKPFPFLSFQRMQGKNNAFTKKLDEMLDELLEPHTSKNVKKKMDEFDTLHKIVEQLEACNYQCEQGRHDLNNNVAFMKLKEFARQVPVLTPGIRHVARSRHLQINDKDLDFKPFNTAMYNDNQLTGAAIYLLTKDDKYWPNWPKALQEKYKAMPYDEMLRTAGAFIVSEIDRVVFETKSK